MRSRRNGLLVGAPSAQPSSAYGSSSPTTTEAAASGASSGGELKLTAQNIAFSPTSLTAKAGGKVTIEFTNKDSVEHNFTLDGQNVNKDVEGGEDATVSFDAPP